jgi:hypothetical protein
MHKLWIFALGLSLVVSDVSAGQFTVTVDDTDLKNYMTYEARVAHKGATTITKTPQQQIQAIVDQALTPMRTARERLAACAKVTDAAAKKTFGCP